MIPKAQQRTLLELARNAIQVALRKGPKPPAVEGLFPLLREKRGVFVTLWEEDLRGCIGFPYPVKPLFLAVQEAAVSAALEDPRFPPLDLEELSLLQIEISVLTEPKPIEPEEVKIGVHGLIVRQGNRSGLLLPQVAMDHHWDAESFLSQTCVKAGLPPDTWKKRTGLFAFEAQVFSEGDLESQSGGPSH